MSSQHVELIRDAYSHFNRAGEPRWELFHADAEFDPSALPGLDIVKGRDAVVAMIRDYAAAFEGWRIEPEEIRSAGKNQVVARVRDGGRLKGSSAEVFNSFTHVWSFQGGKVIRWKTYTEHSQALEDVGLRQ